MDELDHYMVHTPPSSDRQACSSEGVAVAPPLVQLWHGFQEGAIPDLAGIQLSCRYGCELTWRCADGGTFMPQQSIWILPMLCEGDLVQNL